LVPPIRDFSYDLMESYGSILLPVIFNEEDSFSSERALFNVLYINLTCNAMIGIPTLC
jgi:hypothetical protein